MISRLILMLLMSLYNTERLWTCDLPTSHFNLGAAWIIGLWYWTQLVSCLLYVHLHFCYFIDVYFLFWLRLITSHGFALLLFYTSLRGSNQLFDNFLMLDLCINFCSLPFSPFVIFHRFWDVGSPFTLISIWFWGFHLDNFVHFLCKKCSLISTCQRKVFALIDRYFHWVAFRKSNMISVCLYLLVCLMAHGVVYQDNMTCTKKVVCYTAL